MMRWRKVTEGVVGLCIALYTLSAHGLYLDSTIYDIPAERSFISKRIYNDSHKQNVYSISAIKIDRPGPGGEKRLPIEDGELLFTPLTFSLAPDAGEYFKIFYRGPEDDKERYYRIQFREMPVTLFAQRHSGKASEAVPAIALDTILVVRPRKLTLGYTLDEQKGALTNTGNTFFRIIVHKGCQSTDDEATMRYLLPGETYRSGALNTKNKKFIVALKKYIPIGDGCFKNNS